MVFTPKTLTHSASQIDTAINTVLATQVTPDDIVFLIADFKNKQSYHIAAGGCNSTTRDMRS